MMLLHEKTFLDNDYEQEQLSRKFNDRESKCHMSSQ